jgi:very-short-patch-repair endonuclease
VPGRPCHVDPDNRGQRHNDTADRAIAALANRQGGVVSRGQLVARGISAKAIDYRVAVGRLRAVHRGVYAVGHDAISTRGQLVAGLLVAGAGAALSHRTAAAVWRLTPSMPHFVEITTTNRRRRSRPGLLLHHASAIEVSRRDGLRVTTPIRTLLDLAATRPVSEVEAATSEALVLKLVAQDALGRQAGPGSAVLARLAGAGVAPTRSELERRFLRATRRAGLPAPQVNARVGPYLVDFLWPEHGLVVETDGAAFHRHHLAARRDHARDAELQMRGYVVLRLTWQDVVEEPTAATARIARALSLRATRRAS